MGDVYTNAACYGRVFEQYCRVISLIVETQMFFFVLALGAPSPGWPEDNHSSHWPESRITANSAKRCQSSSVSVLLVVF